MKSFLHKTTDATHDNPSSCPEKRIKKPLLFLIPSAILCITLFLALTQTSRSFHSFTKELFCSELSENTLSMHYTIAYPENFGLEAAEVKLPVFTPESKAAQQELFSGILDFLNSLNPKLLSSKDAYTYELLLSYFENEYNAADYFYYSEPLSPSSGMQTQLPILLAEYTFRSKKDVDDYLKLIEKSEGYFKGLLRFEQEKSAAGLFMSDTAVEKVIVECDSIMDTSLLKDGSHFLQTTFEERLLKLKEQGLLTDAEIEYYISQNNRLLTTVMSPAYTALSDGLFLLSGTGKNPGGLAGFEHGREYYLYLLKKDVGCYLDINDIKTMLCEDFDKNLDELTSITRKNPTLLTLASDGRFSTVLPFEDEEPMLQYLQKRMEKDFPPLTCEVSYSLKEISKSLAAYSSPAFYLTAPLDDYSNNVIYLNPNSNYGRLELFTTLAHEGYPGHLYQCVYNNSKNAKNNPIRNLLGYTGYAEGYALYVELLSYDYASELALSAGDTEAAQYYQLLKVNRKVQLCLYSLMDVAIHYDNADYAKIETFLSAMGVKNSDVCHNIYEYIAEEPANYLKYYLGYLEILSLKEKAIAKWGDSYTDYDFHQFYLDAGPSDFQTLERHLN